MSRAQEVVDFWVKEVGPEGWYDGSPELDQTIRDKFLDDWELARRGKLDKWGTCPEQALALVILLDQFPRNMFRGDGKSFATDRKARCIARHAIDRNFDLRTPEPQRQFYYLPLMHSESLTDQERCIRLMKTRLPLTGESNLFHAKVHRAVIRKFGRFPYRNDALQRQYTMPERAYIAAGGYQETVRLVQG
jgi:uncharacterized protein (DUF924 family)